MQTFKCSWNSGFFNPRPLTSETSLTYDIQKIHKKNLLKNNKDKIFIKIILNFILILKSTCSYQEICLQETAISQVSTVAFWPCVKFNVFLSKNPYCSLRDNTRMNPYLYIYECLCPEFWLFQFNSRNQEFLIITLHPISQ